MELIVCRDMGGWRQLALLAGKINEEVCVASDDPEVRALSYTLPNVKTVAYVEQMDSLYGVAEDVKAAIKSINLWLTAHGEGAIGGIPKELIYWLEHVEGGMTSQRIQDLMLLIKSYHQLLDSTAAAKVVLIWCRGSSWEDQVLLSVCRSRGIPVRQFGINRIQQLSDALRHFVKNLVLREPLNMARALSVKLFAGKRSKPKNREIMFQLGSALPRHVNNILPIMLELKNIGYQPVALCWTAYKAAAHIKKTGVSAVNLESYLSLRTLFGSYIRMWLTWVKLKKSKPSFLSNTLSAYQDVALGGLLWPSIKHFVMCELAQDYRYQQAIKNYMSQHSPLAVKLWGGDAFKEGQALIRCLKTGNRPLLMFWFRGFTNDPYEKDTGNINLYLAAGKNQREYLNTLGVKDDRIRVVGMNHLDELPEFIKRFSSAESRQHLGIAEGYTQYILFDLSVPYRGLLSPREFQTVMDFMGDFALRNPSLALIAKPHPSASPKTVQYFREKYFAPNVYVLDGAELPYHAINAADFLVCKCTTLGLEAMLFRKPVVSIALDGEPNFRIFGNAARYVDSLAAMQEFLASASSDSSIFEDRKLEQASRGERFIKDYLGSVVESSAKLSARAVDALLSDKTTAQEKQALI